MIKTNYLGAMLESIELIEEGIWGAVYFHPSRYFSGSGSTPESAVADAQRMIQESQGLRKRG